MSRLNPCCSLRINIESSNESRKSRTILLLKTLAVKANLLVEKWEGNAVESAASKCDAVQLVGRRCFGVETKRIEVGESVEK
jgi:hypothetical protein